MPDTDDQASSTGGQAQVQSTGLMIPESVKAQFPQLIEMIIASESMNDGERQYWVEILPVMTTEQVQQLEQILKNERDQLAAIDEKYGKQIEEIAEQKRPLQEMEQARRSRSNELSAQEESARKSEEQKAEEILRTMSEL